MGDRALRLGEGVESLVSSPQQMDALDVLVQDVDDPLDRLRIVARELIAAERYAANARAARERLIVEAYTAGVSTREIARAAGIGDSLVSRLAHGNGAERRRAHQAAQRRATR